MLRVAQGVAPVLRVRLLRPRACVPGRVLYGALDSSLVPPSRRGYAPPMTAGGGSGVSWRILAARGAANAAQRPAVSELPVIIEVKRAS